MKYRYTYSNSNDPYHNLAMEQALFDVCKKNEAILYLWQNSDTIVIGRNQSLYRECRVDEFIQSGGRIARRRSGGGAVYHDLGNLNYSLICATENKEQIQYHRLISEALHCLGLNTQFNGRNDILLNGKKFSGNAVFDNGGMICQHGTILVNCDIDRMQHFLTPDSEKLDRNCVKSVSARVTNLSELKNDLSVKDICLSIINSTGALPLQEEVSADYLSRLTEAYSSSRWIIDGVDLPSAVLPPNSQVIKNRKD